jgi:effector-binding domain-containing protein
MMDEITVVELKPQLVLGMRKRAGYEEIGTMIQELYEFAADKNIGKVGRPIFICHEETVEQAMEADKNKNADLEVAISISEKVEETEDFKCYELPGEKMAKTVHKGPYEDCGPTYKKLFAWLEENGKRIVGLTREVYVTDPREVPPEEYLTEIYTPID